MRLHGLLVPLAAERGGYPLRGVAREAYQRRRPLLHHLRLRGEEAQGALEGRALRALVRALALECRKPRAPILRRRGAGLRRPRGGRGAGGRGRWVRRRPLGDRVVNDGVGPPAAAQLDGPGGLEPGACLGALGKRRERQRLDEERHNQALELLDLAAAFHRHIWIRDVVDEERRDARVDVGAERGVIAARLELADELRELVRVDAAPEVDTPQVAGGYH